MKCAKCGAELTVGSKFCNVCGTKIDTNLKCAKCGADISKNSHFCDACGTKVAAPIDQSRDVVRHAAPPAVGATPNERIKLALGYVLTPIGAIIVMLTTKDYGKNKFVQTHMNMALFYGMLISIFWFGGLPQLSFLLYIYVLYCAYRAFTGKQDLLFLFLQQKYKPAPSPGQAAAGNVSTPAPAPAPVQAIETEAGVKTPISDMPIAKPQETDTYMNSRGGNMSPEAPDVGSASPLATTPQIMVNNTSKPPNKNKIKLLLVSVCILLFIGVIGIVVLNNNSNTNIVTPTVAPSPVFNNYLNAKYNLEYNLNITVATLNDHVNTYDSEINVASPNYNLLISNFEIDQSNFQGLNSYLSELNTTIYDFSASASGMTGVSKSNADQALYSMRSYQFYMDCVQLDSSNYCDGMIKYVKSCQSGSPDATVYKNAVSMYNQANTDYMNAMNASSQVNAISQVI